MRIAHLLVPLVLCTLVAAAPPGGEDAPKHTNRLAKETSPYLLQHAHNPVDWYPWGEEAFAAARAAGKPIFLSIGYSTCYWCHVMERESFENEAVAAIMNERFICIKVDRESRPDVDDVYMAAVQALTGRGGWPLSVFLEPTGLRPFAGGTYFAPTPRYGKPSFTELLRTTADEWQAQRPAVEARAQNLARRVEQRLARPGGAGALGADGVRRADDVERVVATLVSGHDAQWGGLRRTAPKFPQPARLELLIGAGWEDPAARVAVTNTLDHMATGGIYDQVGGGFHRYSTDRRWLVPHFEKMLYDNAQLASVYAKAWERTQDPLYEKITRETLEYVRREMTSPDGAFYSAQDAEVNAREGESYVWTPVEIEAALTDAGLADDVGFALNVYGLKAGTNFRDPHHPGDPPRNVLFLRARPDVVARTLDMDAVAFSERLARVNQALLVARDAREQPGTDDKILAGWNGLMIAAFVDGARALGNHEYLHAARAAAWFVLERMRHDPGRLFRTHRAGEARVDAPCGDSALVGPGLLTLYRHTRETGWLAEARALMVGARKRFWDEQRGGWYDTLEDQPDLFVRVKPTRDGVIPSVNSLMLANLVDLYELTGERSYLDDAWRGLHALDGKERTSQSPTATLVLHRLLDEHPGALARAPTRTRPTPPEARPVTLSTSLANVTLGADETATIEAVLDIGAGYHVNAHEPGIDDLVGLNVHLVGKGAVIEVDYPTGEAFGVRQFPGREVRVHGGRVTIPIRIRRVAAAEKGRVRLVLTYQVCTERECLRETRRVLPVKIELK